VIAAATVSALGPAASGAASARYTVIAVDFKFKFSSTRIRAGTDTFTVINRGQATHDFKIAGKKTRRLDPGQRQTIKVTLKKGRYTVLCTVPGHATLGMKNTLVVR
jgi:plastocyanin